MGVHLSIGSAVVNRISLVMLYVCSFLMKKRKNSTGLSEQSEPFLKGQFLSVSHGLRSSRLFLSQQMHEGHTTLRLVFLSESPSRHKQILPVLLTACEREKVLCFFGAPSKGKRLTGTTETQRINSGMRLCVRE